MKTIIFITIIFCAAHTGFGQEPSDALRYSWLTQSGTARNQAIGGASASLGGEFSTLFVNPAGLGFYKTSEFVFTPFYKMQKNKSIYKGEKNQVSDNQFNLSASGILFSLPSYNSKIKNFTIALGVNKAADFNSSIFYKGVNNQTSYADKYLEEIKNSNSLDPNKAANDFPYGASLAFNTYLIDTISSPTKTVIGYKKNANPATGLNQQNKIESSGGITDFALGGAVNINEKLFLGGSFTLALLNYNRDSEYKESDATNNIANNFSYAQINETLETNGMGGNIKLGVIYKPVEYVRLGLTLHTPTYYELKDKYSTEVITDLEGYAGAGVKKQSSKDFNNGQPAELKYNLITPLRVMASASYVFREVENVKKQRAFITADVEYVNYKTASFKAIDENVDTKNYFSQLDDAIDAQYKSALNFRLGGELKFNTIMFRLGGAYYSNPYKNEKADKVKLSGGLGYRNKGIFIDLTYVYAINKDVNYPYRLQYKAYDGAALKSNEGNIVATVGFKL